MVGVDAAVLGQVLPYPYPYPCPYPFSLCVSVPDLVESTCARCRACVCGLVWLVGSWLFELACLTCERPERVKAQAAWQPASKPSRYTERNNHTKRRS